MGINLGVSSLVVIILCTVSFIAGTVLLVKTNYFGHIIPAYPIPETEITVSVYPQNSMPGTQFLIKAVYPTVREEEDLMLYVRGKEGSEILYLFDDGKHNDDGPNDGLYAGVYDSSAKTQGIYEVVSDNKKLGEFVLGNQGCELIFGNSDDDKINFVILPYGYENFDEFRSDAQNIITGAGGLLETQPFKSEKDKFSFSLSSPTKNLECEVGCKGISALICCDNSRVFQEAGKCHYDFVLVLVNDSGMCGSASNYAKICAKNEHAKLILLHELGHSFADLADEYTYSDYYGDYNVGKVNNANCDEEGCNKWTNVTLGCYEGCTYSDLYRPKEQNSIMLDLYPEYNEVCQNKIVEVINNHIQVEKQIESLLPAKKSYELVFNYNNGSVKMLNSALKPIKSAYAYKESDYSAKIFNENGEVLYASKVYIPQVILPIPGTYSIPVFLNEFDFLLSMPYSDNADKLVLYKNERELEEVELAIYSDKCGDGICQASENNLVCLSDCLVDSDNLCQSGSCDSNCESKPSCEFNKRSIFYIILMAGSLIVMILVILTSYSQSKKLEREYNPNIFKR